MNRNVALWIGLPLSVGVALTLQGCGEYEPPASQPVSNPVVDVLRGNVYIENGESFGVTFKIRSETLDSETQVGTFEIGGDRGEFVVEQIELGKYGVYGNSEKCHPEERSKSDGTKETVSVCNRNLTFGLSVTQDAIDGATPSGSDNLAWELTRSDGANDSQVVSGVIHSLRNGDIPVTITAEADGSTRGEMTIGTGAEAKTIIMNGFVPADVRNRIPAIAQALMLTVAALHIGA